MKSNDIATEASNMLVQSGLFSVPVDLDKLATHFQVKIHVEALEDEVSGMLVVTDGATHIVVNKNHHPNRQRFTIAHEIGHLRMHHRDGDQLFVDTKLAVYHRIGSATSRAYAMPGSTTNSEQERQANVFAASLLMPEALLREYIDSRQLDISDEFDISLLANAFGVSEQAMSIRLKNLQFIDYTFD